jgi:hypothetical protein
MTIDFTLGFVGLKNLQLLNSEGLTLVKSIFLLKFYKIQLKEIEKPVQKQKGFFYHP